MCQLGEGRVKFDSEICINHGWLVWWQPPVGRAHAITSSRSRPMSIHFADQYLQFALSGAVYKAYVGGMMT